MKKYISLLTIMLSSVLIFVQPVHAAQKRISGSSRYDTAVQISRALFEHADTVILANGYKFIDALPGSTLANILDAPILLTEEAALPQVTSDEMNRLEAKNVYILGGKATIQENVENDLQSKGYKVLRIGGLNRYHSSELIYQEILRFGPIKEVVIAAEEADAVSSSGLRGQDIPLILIDDPEPSDFVMDIKIKKTCLGGTDAISQKTYRDLNAVQRICGSDHFSTAVKIAEVSDKPNLVLVNAYNFVDAFTASVYAYQKNADVLLTTAQSLSQESADYIQKRNPKEVTIIGGDSSVSEEVYKMLSTIIQANPQN